MYCSKCGSNNELGSVFCRKCGEVLEKDNSVNENKDGEINDYTPKQETNYQTKKVKEANLGVISLILGIISFITSMVFTISILTGIAGLILGFKSKIKNGLSIAGIVLSIIGLLSTVIITVIGINKTYYGEGYHLKYGMNWSIVKLQGEQDAFQYKSKKSFLAPIGNSPLSDMTVDFNTTSGQEKLYKMFYDYWNNSSSNSSTLKIYNGSNGFNKLTDDIYFATYDYGASANAIYGKYILLVSTEKNSILSFMTRSDENVGDNDNRAIKLLKNIKID